MIYLQRYIARLKTHEKVKMACVVRLNMMRPYIKKWPEVLIINWVVMFTLMVVF